MDEGAWGICVSRSLSFQEELGSVLEGQWLHGGLGRGGLVRGRLENGGRQRGQGRKRIVRLEVRKELSYLFYSNLEALYLEIHSCSPKRSAV